MAAESLAASDGGCNFMVDPAAGQPFTVIRDPEAAGPIMIDCSRSVVLAGILHITHGATKDLGKVDH